MAAAAMAAAPAVETEEAARAEVATVAATAADEEAATEEATEEALAAATEEAEKEEAATEEAMAGAKEEAETAAQTAARERRPRDSTSHGTETTGPCSRRAPCHRSARPCSCRRSS